MYSGMVQHEEGSTEFKQLLLKVNAYVELNGGTDVESASTSLYTVTNKFKKDWRVCLGVTKNEFLWLAIIDKK